MNCPYCHREQDGHVYCPYCMRRNTRTVRFQNKKAPALFAWELFALGIVVLALICLLTLTRWTHDQPSENGASIEPEASDTLSSTPYSVSEADLETATSNAAPLPLESASNPKQVSEPSTRPKDNPDTFIAPTQPFSVSDNYEPHTIGDELIRQVVMAVRTALDPYVPYLNHVPANYTYTTQYSTSFSDLKLMDVQVDAFTDEIVSSIELAQINPKRFGQPAGYCMAYTTDSWSVGIDITVYFLGGESQLS